MSDELLELRPKRWKVTLRVLNMGVETRLCDRIIYSRTVKGFRTKLGAMWYGARRKPKARWPHYGDYLVEAEQ